MYDQINWSNKQFQQVVNTVQSYNNCRSAWLEQRAFFDIYLETVRGHPVYDIIQDELNDTFGAVKKPDLEYFKLVSPTETFSLFPDSANPIQVSFDGQLGSIAKLARSEDIYWTDATSQLAGFVYITYNETDFAALSQTYGNPGYDKPNSTINANPQSRVWLPKLTNFYQSKTMDNVFAAQLAMDDDAVNLYGGFKDIWLLYYFLDDSNFIFEWTGLNKTATRLAEASMINFLLPKQPTCSLIQYDTKVDVQQAAGRTSYYQRGVDSITCQSSLSDKCFVTLNAYSFDAPIGQ